MPLFLIPFIVLAVVAIVAMLMSVRVIQQQQVGIVQRLGKFHKTIEPGMHLITPVVDKVTYTMDMREAVVPFPPQGVITEDNLMVGIDSVIYFQIVDPVRAAYEAQNYIQAIEQLTMTTLRNIIGGMDLEQTLTSREDINHKLRSVLDEATGKWGIKVNRVELRSIEPPATIRDAMEKGARAEREKRAQILLAEGQRQSQILNASGDRESSILRAQGERESAVLRAQADRQASMLRAEGEAQAITTVFGAIHASEPDQGLLAYQYLQMLPKLAQGDANKVWVIPSELNDALKGLGSTVGEAVRGYSTIDKSKYKAPAHVDVFAEIEDSKKTADEESKRSVAQAIAEAQQLESGRLARLGIPQLEAQPAAGVDPVAQFLPEQDAPGATAATGSQFAPPAEQSAGPAQG
jgi:regulator of protease activity HflC (stomatin/prohibitin superfamily)